MAKDSMAKSISNFSQQLSRFNNSSSVEPVRQKSQDALLQEKIDQVELLRKERIIRQLDSFRNPISQQIEKDESDLICAYNLFKQAFELNSQCSDSETKIADLRIKSPLCSRSEYLTGSGFSFLRLWFLEVYADAVFVPVIEKYNENNYLFFIPRDEYEFSKFEKEVIQLKG